MDVAEIRREILRSMERRAVGEIKDGEYFVDLGDLVARLEEIEKSGPSGAEAARAAGPPPAGLFQVFQAPWAETDHVGNPVAVRGGRKVDLATGWPIEIWLPLSEAPGSIGDGPGKPEALEFVLVPPGQFMTDSPAAEEEWFEHAVPMHTVPIAEPFYIGKYEVTQGQWESVTGKNPSHFKGAGKDAPVEGVSSSDCDEFARILEGKCRARLRGAGKDDGALGEADRQIRLPSAAEWEYACRAGTKTRFHSGETEENLEAAAWFRKNSGDTTHPVGRKTPNDWGAYDMHGNVSEWCENHFLEFHPEAEDWDPRWTNWNLWCGGSWGHPEYCCTSDSGGRDTSGNRSDQLGVRLLFEPIVHRRREEERVREKNLAELGLRRPGHFRKWEPGSSPCAPPPSTRGTGGVSKPKPPAPGSGHPAHRCARTEQDQILLFAVVLWLVVPLPLAVFLVSCMPEFKTAPFLKSLLVVAAAFAATAAAAFALKHLLRKRK
ncbi:MAG: formylglycine-generating enzyme family protein [Planctomycetes bacterium]|jgi:formylglycine-generating enzyme required for sulfatase activity|nr:formylglycine-generating enzyme family protein [Planctomycetota bacterium]